METNKTVQLDRLETSDMLMNWSHDLRCCSASLWLLLETMVSQEEEREHALITLVVKTLEEVNDKIVDFDTNKL
ncbi:hypothetical protein G6546_21080 [Citrobacter portucalensis]|jgi:hypothetical protein|uniref:hypothetical protein n=1 Tax=Citrobacter freundii complex TaxID=1344959 RepID=UPI0009ABFCB6|nr:MULTISPECIES: hypothetical protein [Citrobacter freundii complex]MBA7975504.1 hypothetical protein [Citrobacter freundii]AUV42937.1 hypothetical protein C2U43_08740 [Citrobacter freundii complex sp. CFNIH9]MBJ9828000.1 hypothetical protein [Citrobacter freundii]MDE9663098.1 hypothetical protein [Citrobacter portucalensis]MDE9672194.1 hypothetical protein [Citrobacter portucalensis]